MENYLRDNGRDVRVIENCLNGRRTAWDDPFKPGRNGVEGLAQVIEMNSPLELVIIMLGTNDFQCVHDNNAWASAQGMARLISIIKSAPIEPGMPIPGILVVAPPRIKQPKNDMTEKFEGAAQKSAGLHEELIKITRDQSVYFYDAAKVTESSPVDGIHLDVNQHSDLGKAIASEILEKILEE